MTDVASASVPPSASPELAELRAQIDAVDADIAALLKQRMQYVKKVGRLKERESNGLCPIRPGREAEQLRRVVKEFRGSDFSPAAAAAIWRMMIMAALAVEGDIKIAVAMPDKESDMMSLAREYFGPFSAFQRETTPKRAIGAVVEGKAQVAVVPMLWGEENEQWWPSLARGEDQPKVFACLPFVLPPNNKHGREEMRALALGRVNPEPTGADLSLMVIETDELASQHKLQTLLSQVKLEARWIQVSGVAAGKRLHLAEIKGFVTLEHPAYRSFINQIGSSLINTSFLGAYAEPIAL